ncbi:MAG: trypsin-like serine peptidase [Gemmobacter sp.]
MRVAAIALLLSAGAAWPQSGAHLDGLATRDKLLGWEAIGRVDMGDGYCTGTLIATDLVLTAGHCLFDRRTGRPRDPTAIRFRAGLRNGESVAEAAVVRAVAHPRYTPGKLDNRAVRHDVALLQLATPIAAAVAAPFSVARAPAGRTISVVSYGQGRDDIPSWQRECRVLGRRDGLLAFDCDVTFGSSGAPVFDLAGPRAQIVALVSAGGPRGEGTLAFGMELPALIAALQDRLRTGEGVLTGPPQTTPRTATGVRRLSPEAPRGNIGARFVRPPGGS